VENSNLENISFENYFKPAKVKTTRGHPYKVFKPVTQNRARANFWSIRAIDNWNFLPETVVKAKTLNCSK